MGKRKGQAANMGKSIIRDRFRGKSSRSRTDGYIHSQDLNDGYDWGRLNLRSVTEQSNLDDFLSTAQLAGTEFIAEKMNIQIMHPEKRSGLPTEDELSKITLAQNEHRSLLSIPRRPAWDGTTTPDMLDSLEKSTFLQWRRQLASLEEKEHIVLTPFEKNLEFWRQLWRVIERSDVVVQIVDARNPLLFWCPDVDTYVKEICPEKANVLLMNKADFLMQPQRKAWAEYFQEKGMTVAFWSALEETQRIEKEASEKRELGEAKTGIGSVTEVIDDSVRQKREDASVRQKMEDASVSQEMEDASVSQKMEDAKTEEEKDRELEEVIPKECGTEKSFTGNEEEPNVTSLVEKQVPSTNCDAVQDDSSWAVLSGDQLLHMLQKTAVTSYTKGVTTVGMVGYPNVGKSSTINAILRHKKVPVSATPGRTKHFQTLYVDHNLMLCDCPGLVFPSFISTAAELVVNGILPIDQLRDCIPPVNLVCERIPRPVLEAVYGINLPAPGEAEDPDRSPTANELLCSYGYMRGFMTQKGNPDCPRSARYILKDYVNGKLLYCHPPPGINAKLFQATQSVKLLKCPASANSKPKAVTDSQKSGPTTSRLDKEFFSKVSVKAHSLGSHAVADYVRSEGLRQIGSGDGTAASVQSSQQSLAGKPWKKHNNHNKKEKLRRVYAYHDNN